LVQDSIYYYRGIGEFTRFIQRIDNRSLHVYEALSTFRETKCLDNDFKKITIAQLNEEPAKIVALSEALRNGMGPESKFKSPYKKEEREQELIKNLGEYYAIDTQRAKAKVVTGHYKNDKTKQEFNYAIEVAIAPRNSISIRYAGNIEIIGNVNLTPSIDGGESYFDGAYFWLDKNHKPIASTSLRGILQECGFNSSDYVGAAKKKVPSVLYINLNTPCPNWLGGAGKTHIDLTPYASDIAQTVSSLAYKMPSFHGYGYGRSYVSHLDQQKSGRSYLEDFLINRFDAIEKNPSLKTADPLTQSGVWYRIRPVMIRNGYNPKENWGETRKYITGLIDKLCEELFENVEREDLGIVAKARGMMLYEGHTYPITMDTFEELGRKGVFILVIEKEGIVNIFESIARDSGVALVHTAGRFTKYVKNLIEKAQIPVATLTDYDAYGIQISSATISKTPRIGIDMDIIEWLRNNGCPDLKLEDVEEEYTSIISTTDEYLKNHRIELDSIAARVGPRLFWDYVKYKIEKLQKDKGFDYNNIMTRPQPEDLYPEVFDSLISKLGECVENTIEEDWHSIEIEIRNSRHLMSVDELRKKILDLLSRKIQGNYTIQGKIVPKIKMLLSELSSIVEDIA
jgi:hypothetical protein